jgi:hypothetical protein
LLVGGALIAVGLAVLALIAVPIPHAFSGSVSTAPLYDSGFDLGLTNQTLPPGSAVRINWQTVNGQSVDFYVTPSITSSDIACTERGARGTCAFTATSDSYVIIARDFVGPTVVTYGGSYTSPEL